VARIGLIAGNGRFPFLALQGARSLGHDVTVVAVKEEAFPELEGTARAAGADLHWVSLGHLGKCIKILKEAGIRQAVMAGQVKHAKIFSGIMPDLTLLSVLTKLRARNTDALISAVAEVLRGEGIELLNSTAFLEPLLAKPGTLSRATPSPADQEDLAFGYRMADAIAALERQDPAAAAERFIDYWMGPGTWRRTPAARREPIAASMRNVAGWAQALFSEPTPLAAFRALDVPVLCMVGSQSPASSRGVARLLAGALPNVSVSEFDALGHMGPVTHPDVVNEAVAAFLAHCEAPRERIAEQHAMDAALQH